VTLDALVDSGADCSVLPRWVATDLGLDGKLKPGEPIEVVGGALIDTSIFADPIRAQVLIDGKEPWGSVFELRPVFADVGAMLLGRADFFSTFTVTFEEADEPPYFVLIEH
jgi:hypothetical protein